MNSEIIRPGTGAFGSRVYDQPPPAKLLEALLKSRMPWPAAQATCTAPVGGWGKVKTNCEGVTSTRLVAGWLLICRSLASMPATGSLKATSTDVNCRTRALGVGYRKVSIGPLTSGV